MTALYLAAFILGLLVAVGIMLFGIEHDAQSTQRAVMRTWLPLFAAFAAGFGVAGYVASRFATAAHALIIAALVAVVSVLLTRWLVAKSAAMVPEFDVDDERYVLQGHIAHVVQPIPTGADAEGEIAFAVGATQRTLRARSVDATALASGTEVVIERVEGELAFVEPWEQVERRL